MKKRVRAYMRNGRNRRFWKRLLSVLSCVVVFVTTYALLLPAITMEKTAACGMEAHQHDQSCFEQHLICGLEETDGHQHTDDCYTVSRVLACTMEEHSHTEECFNEEGELTCALAEHSHDDRCWREDRVLSCKKEETEPHHHTDACYESVLVCQKPVHIHSPECYVERSLDLAQYLTGDTTIYVRAGNTEGGADGEANRGNADGGITDGAYAADGGTYGNSGNGWLRVDGTAEITAIDLVRLHYAYTIPAGTLTEGNQTLRYALPDNIRLTDDQIRDVNAMNGGRGAQAVEGTRTPDQEQTGNEYVSAWILFENVYKDSDQKHKDPIGQNLVLTFDAATIEKNRKVFGKDGALVDHGQEVNGFFSIDVNTDQISFDRGGDSDGEKETDVTLVEENKDLGIAPIRRTIRVIEAEEEQAEAGPEILNEEARAEEEFTAAGEDAVVEESAVSEDGAVTEENAAAEEDAVIEEDSDTEENAASVEDSAEEDVPAEEAVNGGEAPAEVLAKEGQEDLNQEEQDQEGKSSGEQAADSDKEKEEGKKEKGRTTVYQGVADTLTFEGADYTVTASYTEDAGIPEGASLVVSEITEDDDRKAFESYRVQAEEAVAQEPGRKVSWIRLFDITIEKNGKPIEPQGPVSVQITYHEAIEQAADTTVDTVHFEGKKETPRVLETAAEGTDTATEQVSFETDGFSVFVIVGTTIEKTVLASDGLNYRITVTCVEEAGIPENAQLEVTEILQAEESADGTTEFETYVEKTKEALGLESGEFDYVRFFDIRIVDENGEKVQITAPVEVKIELADAEDGKDLSVVHFADGSEEGDKVSADIDGQSVEFTADGFSVYAVVNAPEPVPQTGWNKAATVEQIAELGSNGFYIRSYGGFYFTDQTYSPSNGRTGIRKTKPASGDPTAATNNNTNAVKYYFELVEGTSDQFHVYYKTGDTKIYIRQSGNSLTLTEGLQEDTASATSTFTIDPFPGTENTFRMLGVNGYYWNMQGNDGGNGFCAYNNATDNNARIQLQFLSTQEDDPYGLDGMTYGIAYNDESVTANGVVISEDDSLAVKDMLIKPDVLDNDGCMLVSNSSDITEWVFESQGEDKYYITTIVDEQKKYLTISGTSVTLEDEPGDNSLITAIPGTGEHSGKWHFIVNNYYLNITNRAINAVSGYSTATTWLNLVEKSVLNDDDFNLYTAQKVSVSDTVNVYDGQQVVIYTRIWNDTTKKYEFYAVSHDGSLIRCYDTGDGIEWVGTQVNTALWSFAEGTNTDGSLSYYYWLRNTQYGNYLVPQAASGKVSYESAENADFNASINLNGRRYGENYTTIIAWDDAQYAFSGLKTENGHVVPCPLAEAQDFYFAVMNLVDTDDKLTTVDTLDNDQYGITMKMVDYNNAKTGNATSPRDSVQNPFFGGDNNTAGLLSTNLEDDGYPSATEVAGNDGSSLSTLYEEAVPVNHLFIESIHNESGYFEYDSTSNFAHLNSDGTFTVYDQIGTIGDYNTATGTHGQFMPYDDLTPGKYASFTNQTDVLGKELSDLNPRKGEKLYDIGIRSQVDYHFGMELSASFTQTPSGLDAWGHDIIFEFSGDDDFWLYVDGELILDLGGVHSAMAGNVNFRTGEVTSGRPVEVYRNGGFITNASTYTLRERFEANYRRRNPDASEADVAAYLDGYFYDGGTVFKDYTSHEMKIFYMERGAGASNLHMRFNLAAVKPGSFLLSKKLSGTELEDSSLIEFPYQIYYYTTLDGEAVHHLLGAGEGEADLVLYEGSTRTLNSAGKYMSSFTPAQGTTPYEHVFFLKPGETAEVILPDGATDYYVAECGVNPDIYDEVRANSILLNGIPTANSINGTGRMDYATSRDSMENRSSVEYDNHVSNNAMRTLSITKKLYDIDGITELTYPEPGTTFTFRMYLGDENADANALPPANLYSYYIKDVDGNYCRWDAGSQQFVSLGVASYEALQQYFTNNGWTDAQKESVIFKTSMNGSISRIPAGYTVEVRDLVISTQYKVEERDWEIPKGYTRRDADGYARVDAGHETTQRIPYSGTIANGEDPEIQVRNQKGWGLTVEKVWTDKDFMASHDDIYFAVYVGDSLAKIPDQTEESYDGDEVVYTTVYKDCVRVLRSPETELYFFFGDLYNGTPGSTHDFSQYIVKEVQLKGSASVQLDEEGYVTNLTDFEVSPIPENEVLTIGGTPMGGSHQDGYEYKVSYQIGDITGRNENIRTDTVTNSRPGIKLYKSDWSGTWMSDSTGKAVLSGALSGAKFTLKDSSGNDVAAASYISGSDGLITIAYLNAGTYTLTETETPDGYVRLDSPITITVANDGAVSVNGVDDSYYILDTTADTTMAAVITIKNRTTELQVKKVDEKTKEALADVHFALYRQVTDTSGNSRKDYLPMADYADLVTDENGFLPDITMALGAGTYYLTETQTQSGYTLLSEDICFTIGRDGTVTVNNGSDTGSTLTRTDDTENGNTTYLITIPNYKLGVKLKKVDDNSNALTGAEFSLYIKNDSSVWVNVPNYAVIDMTSSSVTTLSDLADGLYKLAETVAPSGYVILDKEVFFKIENGTVELTKEDGTALTDNGGKAALSTETDQNKNMIYVITVTNTPGVELPATGGTGTSLIYLLGTLLTGFAGTGLLMKRRRRNAA